MDVHIELLGEAHLKDICGPKTLARGQTYATSGAVHVTVEDRGSRPALHANVAGTAHYTTSVAIEDGELTGECDCPSAGDGWFCKHMVAVAMVWRHRLAGTELAMDEAARRQVAASARRAATVRQRREALHTFLRGRPADALARKLIELADSYPAVERELKQWQKLADAASEPRDMKALLTEILAAPGRFIPWNETGSWTRQARAALPLLQQAREGDPQASVALGVHALRRCWTVLGKADDSSGAIGDLTRAIGQEWVCALQAAGKQPAGFGETYLSLQVADPFGCYDDGAAEAAMGSAALHRYRELLAAAWRRARDKALARRAEQRAKHKGRTYSAAQWLPRDETEHETATLERLHLLQLQRLGDIDAMLAVLRADLSDPWRYVQITQFLEKHRRPREAFANAEAAYKAFPDDWRVQEDLLRCYEHDGWTEEAFALRRRQYDSGPSVERFHAAMKAARAAGKDTAGLRLELLKHLEKQERSSSSAAVSADRNAARFSHSQATLRDVSLRAAILGSEGHWSEACELVQPPHTCHVELAQQIALHLPAARKADAIALLQRALRGTMEQESSPYRRALKLTGQIAERLKGAERSKWLAQLRVEFKAKRNFVRGLPE